MIFILLPVYQMFHFYNKFQCYFDRLHMPGDIAVWHYINIYGGDIYIMFHFSRFLSIVNPIRYFELFLLSIDQHALNTASFSIYRQQFRYTLYCPQKFWDWQNTFFNKWRIWRALDFMRDDTFIIPHVNFKQSDWSIKPVTFFNVTRFLQWL